MNWDALHTLLELAEAGTVPAASARLGVDATTVLRRVRRLEGEVGRPLLAQVRHGVALTDAGERLVDTARGMRALTHDLDAALAGQETTLVGTIRIATLTPLIARWMPAIRHFLAEHPELTLELQTGLDMASLTEREADIAVRIASEVPDHLVGGRRARVAHAVYAQRELVDALGADYARYDWVSYDLRVFRGVDQFIQQSAPDARIAMRVGGIEAYTHALVHGVGAGVLQCMVGDAHPDLARVGEAWSGDSWLWVLTHPQLRGSARIRVVRQLLHELIAADTDLIEGRA